MDIELVCEGLEFPEGPIAMADGSVILTEIKGRRLTRVKPDGTVQSLGADLLATGTVRRYLGGLRGGWC